MAKRIAIFRGFGKNNSVEEGASKDHWQTALAKETEAYYPLFPNAFKPELKEWMDTVKDLDLDEDLVVVCHSLGCLLALQLLLRDESPRKISHLVLVAPAALNKLDQITLESGGTLDTQVKDFYAGLENFNELSKEAVEKLKSKVNQFTVIYSDNDPLVNPEEAEALGSALGAKMEKKEKAGHIGNSYDGPSPVSVEMLDLEPASAVIKPR